MDYGGGDLDWFIVWIAILVTQLCFRKHLNQQQIGDLSYKAVGWPFASWFAISFVCFVIGLMWYSELTRMAFYVGPPILILLTIFYFIFGLHKKDRREQ